MDSQSPLSSTRTVHLHTDQPDLPAIVAILQLHGHDPAQVFQNVKGRSQGPRAGPAEISPIREARCP